MYGGRRLVGGSNAGADWTSETRIVGGRLARDGGRGQDAGETLSYQRTVREGRTCRVRGGPSAQRALWSGRQREAAVTANSTWPAACRVGRQSTSSPAADNSRLRRPSRACSRQMNALSRQHHRPAACLRLQPSPSCESSPPPFRVRPEGCPGRSCVSGGLSSVSESQGRRAMLHRAGGSPPPGFGPRFS